MNPWIRENKVNDTPEVDSDYVLNYMNRVYMEITTLDFNVTGNYSAGTMVELGCFYKSKYLKVCSKHR